MNYRDLLNSGVNVSVTLKLEDLREIFKEMVSSIKPKTNDQSPEDFLSRKEVLNLLKIDSSTLWSWEKTGYILHSRILITRRWHQGPTHPYP